MALWAKTIRTYTNKDTHICESNDTFREKQSVISSHREVIDIHKTISNINESNDEHWIYWSGVHAATEQLNSNVYFTGKSISSHGCFLTYSMQHTNKNNSSSSSNNNNNRVLLTKCDETQKRAKTRIYSELKKLTSWATVDQWTKPKTRVRHQPTDVRVRSGSS